MSISQAIQQYSHKHKDYILHLCFCFLLSVAALLASNHAVTHLPFRENFSIYDPLIQTVITFTNYTIKPYVLIIKALSRHGSYISY